MLAKNFRHGQARNAGELKAYVNGQEVTLPDKVFGSGTLSGSLPNVDFLFIGRGQSGSGHYKGVIDEVEIYNRALSAAEIQAIFNAGCAGKCKNQPPVAQCQNVTVLAEVHAGHMGYRLYRRHR